MSAVEKAHEETKLKLEGEIAKLHEAKTTAEQETQQKADSQQHTEVKLKVDNPLHMLPNNSEQI